MLHPDNLQLDLEKVPKDTLIGYNNISPRVKNCATGAKSRGLCVAHRGGRRCQKKNCTTGAKSGGFFCRAHRGLG